MRTQQKDDHLQAKRRGPPNETYLASTLILDFPTSKIVRNEFLLFKPPSLWYFIMAAWADKYHYWVPTLTLVESHKLCMLAPLFNVFNQMFCNHTHTHTHRWYRYWPLEAGIVVKPHPRWREGLGDINGFCGHWPPYLASSSCYISQWNHTGLYTLQVPTKATYFPLDQNFFF